MDKKKLLVVLAVVAVVGLATFFRMYDITNYPPGLFPDEAANGEDALLIMEGDYRPFYPRGNGRESLFFYLEAISLSLFGVGVWQLHLVAALIGVLTVLATYFATRVWFGRLAGILAAGLLATNHWHVTMSRTGFRAILIPLLVALFTAWVGYTIQAVKKKRSRSSM
ncbi:glycosyltransferase family 39 protein, partial [Patescibacteria group bacterium]|nr:glycosyltransferase family 39 protein [Patescibacteria group bacterium]